MDVLAAGTKDVSSAAQNIDIDVEKIWQDADNTEGKRPQSITVDLKNGSEVIKSVTS